MLETTFCRSFNTVSDQIQTIPHWPLPAVRDLTRDGRLSTYDESVLVLSKVSCQGKCARTGHPLKLPSTKLARLGHFPPASQAGRLDCPVFYTISFLCSEPTEFLYHPKQNPRRRGCLRQINTSRRVPLQLNFSR